MKESQTMTFEEIYKEKEVVKDFAAFVCKKYLINVGTEHLLKMYDEYKKG